MPTVSVIIPTCNRPELVKKAIRSVLNQTYQDFEIIVVDDGIKKRAEEAVKSFTDQRIRYIKHNQNRGGAAARNTGIRAAQGEFIAFLDDDDQWLPEKLEIQMEEFINTPAEVGFCFTAVTQKRDEGDSSSQVPSGVVDYYEQALRTFKGILTSSLIIKKQAFDKVGLFDENFPSHQEAELMIRLSREYKGLGINKPLVVMIVFSKHQSVGKNLDNRIAGREQILEKHFAKFRKRPQILAKHYFQLALFYRDNGQYKNARRVFRQAWRTKFSFRYFLHYLLSFWPRVYDKWVKFK